MLRFKTIDDLSKYKKADFINDTYHSRVEEMSDFDDDVDNSEYDKGGHGKRIPYIGWFWRRVDFVGGLIPIGDCGDFVGVMQNNKWGYKERYMTEEEVLKFMTFVDLAYAVRYEGGVKEYIRKKKFEVTCRAMWNWFQTLKI